MNDTTDLAKRTLTIKRTFNAPVQLVWEAWTQPEHIAAWWGPKGMETRILEHNFQEGGAWKYAMTMPDGREFIAEGRYAEIVEASKIATSADFKPMTEGVQMEIVFEADGDKTHLALHVIHPTEAYAKQQEEMGFMNGWGSVFDRLGEFLFDRQAV